MEQKRGQLTNRIKEKSKELLGYEISVKELRLMVYVQYVLTNEQILRRNCISVEEIEILEQWLDAGYLVTLIPKLKITKKFWDIICELIYLGYVDLSDGEDK